MFVAHRLRTIYDSGETPSLPLPRKQGTKIPGRLALTGTDQIIVLQNGAVAETPGSHEQLINSGGVYSSLWAGEFFLSLFLSPLIPF